MIASAVGGFAPFLPLTLGGPTLQAEISEPSDLPSFAPENEAEDFLAQRLGMRMEEHIKTFFDS